MTTTTPKSRRLPPPPAARTTYRSVFAVGEFRVLFATLLMFVLGFEFEILGLSVLVYAQTRSAFWTALAFSMGFAPQALGGALFTSLADRLPPRMVIAAGLLTRAVPGLVIGLWPALPVPAMLATELTLARSGAIDADLSGAQPFYGTDFTKPLLFLNDGAYYANQAIAEHLTGNQWGVMNETGSYPGQPWLWLYQMWYHVPGWRNSHNIDLIAIYMTGAATILLLAIPFIPGLRDIPRWIPVHRLIWRTWHQQAAAGPVGQSEPEPAGQK